ncbi:GTP 3',8-cyclase MoaA [Lagierella sp.]|uniref:GTP 3',8-cyclase MoaA n=1 Tax=Lagierella sp. TaxID=2849657 RepID=UPI002610667F|nr:GTP 3',8-cyclase MoaA [Lagierella sp.]
MKDRFGREINYLRISITDRCNLRCKYCMPENGFCKVDSKEVLTIDEYLKIVKAFKELGIQKVRITGGEPLVKRGVVDLIRGIKEIGIKDIAMTTNGILLGDMAKELKGAGLDRVNISLDSLNPTRYREITRGGDLQRVLESIEICKKVGIKPIKINTVVLRSFNLDEFRNFVDLTKNEDIIVRFIELMPIGEAIQYRDNFVSNEELIKLCGNLVPVETKKASGPAKYYRIEGYRGKVGFINPISCNFCKNCNRLRLTVKGKIVLCLHSNKTIDIKTPLRQNRDIKEVILKAIAEKPEHHSLIKGEYNKTDMNEIGG